MSGSIMRRLKGLMFKHMHAMISCKEFEEFVLGYFEETLPADQKKKFEWHLRFCRECREYLAAYERTIEVAQSALGEPDDPIPSSVPEDLVKAVLDSRKP